MHYLTTVDWLYYCYYSLCYIIWLNKAKRFGGRFWVKLFCYRRYHLKNYSQVNELVNNIQYLLIFNSSRQHKILHVFDHTFVFVAISCLSVSNSNTCSTENFNANKERNQKVKILLANIDVNAAAVFSICTERNSKVRNVDLGFKYLKPKSKIEIYLWV